MATLSQNDGTATVARTTQEPQNLAEQGRVGVVDQILARWPLRAMCARLNIELPDRDGVKFSSPFRHDDNPSCEVYQETIRDRTRGETFDSINVFAKVKWLSNTEAIAKLAAELPGHLPAPPASTGVRGSLLMPETFQCIDRCRTLAAVRKLQPEVVQAVCYSIGAVRFARICGVACWVITDGDGHVAEARRLDGMDFPAYGDLAQRKAHTIRGSQKSWPVGMTPRDYPSAGLPVVLGEGGPDYLALWAVAFEAAPAFLPSVMLGASTRINDAALPLFTGRMVTIVAHPDTAGINAASVWARQLSPFAADVSVKQLVGGDVNDLVSAMGAAAVGREIFK